MSKSIQYYKCEKEGFVPLDRFECSHCNTIYKTEQTANQCCECQQCGKIQKTGSSKCTDCQHIDYRNREAKRLAEAEPVEEYAGVYSPTGVGYIGDGYSHDIDEFREAWLDEHGNLDDLPERVFACEIEQPYCDVSAENVVEWIYSECVDAWEGMAIEGVEELQKALDDFGKKNEHFQLYQTNYDKAVLVNGK